MAKTTTPDEQNATPLATATGTPLPRLHIVLFQPQIPQNTGNVGRLCAITCSRLHLIHPLGFTITDSHLKRSGMDYWHSLDIHHHNNWQAFDSASGSPPAQRRWLLSTKADRSLWDADFAEGDAIIFGNEGHGSPDWLHAAVQPERRITIPQFDPALRSLNLSTAVGIVAYEALRQMLHT